MFGAQAGTNSDLTKLQKTYEEFSKSTIVKKREELFRTYLTELNKFSSNIENRAICQKLFPKIVSTLWTNIQFASRSSELLAELLKNLQNLRNYDGTIPNGVDGVKLFIECCKNSQEKPDLWEKTIEFYQPLFQNQAFVQQFIKNGGYTSFLNQILCNDRYKTIANTIIDYILKIPAKYFKPGELTTIVSYFSTLSKDDKIHQEMKSVIMKFIFSLISEISTNSKELTMESFNAFDGDFLNSFVVKSAPHVLADIITENKQIIKMMIPVYANKKSKPFQASIIKSILDASQFVEDKVFIYDSISEYLCAVPKPRTIRPVLDFMTMSGNIILCDIFLALFVKDVLIAEAFVDCGGIEWLEESRANNLINIEKFSQILGGLVVHRRFAELDRLINHLPGDHPIFSLDKQELDKIVFGMNRSKYRPIRVPSLFRLLDPPTFIDPYNAWMLGNCVVSRYLRSGKNIYDIPFITEIGNRYLKTKHVNLLTRRPFQLERFCDNARFHHFPLFQFYQGREELQFSIAYKAISFWFEITDPTDVNITFFRSEDVTLSVKNDSIFVTIGSIKWEVKMDLDKKFTHVYIFIKESLLTNHIVVQLNKATEFVGARTSRTDFAKASFGWIGRGLMFLGAAIRLYRAISATNNLFEKGPQCMDRLEPAIVESLWTPYAFCSPSSNEPNNSDSKFVTIPSNCVAVPYFGLPFHFLSMRKISKLFQALGTAQTIEEHQALFSTLLRINAITVFNSIRFWPKTMNAMKKYRQFFSKDMFLIALESASMHQRSEQILSSILFDREMWNEVDNGVLISVLFSYFTNVDWSTIEGFDLFLARVVLSNPNNQSITDLVIENNKKVPRVMKHLVSILRSSTYKEPITWEDITNPSKHAVQITVIQSFIKYVNEDTVEDVKRWLKFEKLKYIFLTASEEAAVLIYRLIVTINIYSPGYMKVDHSFLAGFVLFAHRPEVWRDTFLMVTEKPEIFDSKNVLLPLILVLVWSMALTLIHCHSFMDGPPSELDQLIGSFHSGVSILRDHIHRIMNSTLCVSVITSWFPLIFSYTGMLQQMTDGSGQSTIKLCENVSFSQLSEANDAIWIGQEKAIKELKIPPPPPPERPVVFMLSLVREILEHNGFEFPVKNEFDPVAFTSFVESSDLTDLLVDIVYRCPPSLFKQFFNSIFFSKPFHDRGRCSLVAPPLLRAFFKKAPEMLMETFPISDFLDYLMFLSGKRYLAESEADIIDGIFTMLHCYCLKFKSSILKSQSAKINTLIFDLFMHSPPEGLARIIASMMKYLELFSQLAVEGKTQRAWMYAFYTISKRNIPNFTAFVGQFAIFTKLDDKEKELSRAILNNDLGPELFQLIEPAWQERCAIFEKSLKNVSAMILSQTSPFHLEIGALSKDVTMDRHTGYSKHYVTAKGLALSLLVLESTFSLKEERTHWKLFITSQKDRMADINNFCPVSFHLSPRCFPFKAPRVMTPSRFPISDLEGMTFESSPVVSIFTHNSKPLFNPTEYANVTMLELFKRTHSQYGELICHSRCKVIRYSNRIRCVIFVYHTVLLILAFAEDNGRDIILTPPDRESETHVLHMFIESVLLGHWGHTSMFASHIVISIPVSSLIFARRHDEKSIAVWSFKAGHFILKVNGGTAREVLLLAQESSRMPSSQFLFKLRTPEEVYSAAVTGRISVNQMLLGLNSLTSRSFVDLKRMPYFPLVSNGHVQYGLSPPTRDAAYTLLRGIYPFRYHKKNIDTTGFLQPALMFYLSDAVGSTKLLTKMRGDLEHADGVVEWAVDTFFDPKFAVQLRKLKQAPRVVNSVGEVFRNQYCQRINRTCAEHQTLLFERNTVRKIRKLSARIEPNKMNYAVIDKRDLSLMLINKQTGKVHFSSNDPLMAYADSLTVSSNGVFIAVDFEFGLTRIYRILFRNSEPVNAVIVSDFSWSSVPSTVISGCDWIAATANNTALVLWEFITGSVHRFIDIQERIEHTSMDEEFGGIWVATETRLIMFSINGELLAESQLSGITALEALPLPIDCEERDAVIGLQDGGVAIAMPRFDLKEFEIKFLPSEHVCAVDRIAVHPTLEEFLSIDESGHALLWNAVGVTGAVQKLSIFDGCPYCGAKATAYCNVCNRAVCQRCMSEDSPKTMCGMCSAISNYL